MSASLTVDRPLHALSSSSAVRRRIFASAALITGALVFGVALFTVFGPVALASFLPPLPVAIVLLWCSREELRSDEIHAPRRERA